MQSTMLSHRSECSISSCSSECNVTACILMFPCDLLPWPVSLSQAVQAQGGGGPVPPPGCTGSGRRWSSPSPRLYRLKEEVVSEDTEQSKEVSRFVVMTLTLWEVKVC